MLFDDRELATGVKLKDADLVGIPLRVTIGERSIKEGLVELKLRRAKEPVKVKVADAAVEALKLVESELKKLAD